MDNFYFNSIKYGTNFYINSITSDKIQSEHLKSFANNIFFNKKNHYTFSSIEHLREKLLNNNSTIEMIDFGAGSRLNQSKKRKISDIAKTSLSLPKQCKALFWLVNKTQAKTILELGSSLGISTLYLAHAESTSNIFTFEGNPDSIKIAKDQADLLGIKNITFVEGAFDRTLKPTIRGIDSIDIAFIDGNHLYQATKDYFELFLTKVNNESVFIFDDVYWSQGMKQAWEEIKKHPSVTGSLDLYHYGLIFFSPKIKKKEHVKLIANKFKPWQSV